MERVYLVGFMGAGKTSVGRALSEKLGWQFVDLDEEIEKSEGMSVQEIFKQFGEPQFRRLESEHLLKASTRTRAVIALGGGAYVNAENRRIANATGLTVWLKAPFETIRKRVKIDGTRPLFGDNDRAERLYHERIPSYEEAHMHVSVERRPPKRIAAEIARRLDEDRA